MFKRNKKIISIITLLAISLILFGFLFYFKVEKEHYVKTEKIYPLAEVLGTDSKKKNYIFSENGTYYYYTKNKKGDYTKKEFNLETSSYLHKEYPQDFAFVEIYSLEKGSLLEKEDYKYSYKFYIE